MTNRIGDYCRRDVAFTARETTIAAAARMMRQAHVGSLVVVEQMNGGRRVPVGIVTDRDIVVEVTATGLDPGVITVGDIMRTELVTARESDDMHEMLGIMRAKGIRRLPVVAEDGQLAGIFTIDDLLELLAAEIGDIARIVAREQLQEASARR